SIRCSIRCGTIRASKNFAKRNQSELAQLFRGAEAAERLQGRNRLCGSGMAAHSGRVDLLSDLRRAGLGDESVYWHYSSRIPRRIDLYLGDERAISRACPDWGGSSCRREIDCGASIREPE